MSDERGVFLLLMLTVGNMKSADYKEQNYQFKTNINMKTKTSILALTKAFFILIVSVCLFSCGSNLPTNKTMETPYIVKSIETFDKGLCLYNLETGVDNINYRDNISVVDSIGKFVIGDSIALFLNKR